jgi:hypothetical protein
MLKENLKRSKLFLEKHLDKYFPSVRGPVLLIVVPAFFVVLFYFYSIVAEIFIEKYHQPAIDYELRLAALKEDLPLHAVFNYVSDQHEAEDFVLVRYALIPARPVRGMKPKQDYLVVQYLDTDTIPKFDSYFLKRDYGNGVMLFQRNR